jgi:hypothetical protein
MFKRFFVSLALSVSCALLLIGCGGSETPTTNSSNATSTNKTATTTTTTTTSTPATTTSTPASTTSTTASGDKVGVPECDDFITKYEACISDKVPAAARAQFDASLKQWRDSWRQAASTPQGKAGLAQGCKMIAEQSKQSMKPYGCDF